MSRDPYFLYRASNIGSAVGLLSYPLLVEPRLTLDGQGWLWSVGYGALLLLLVGVRARAVALARRPEPEPDGTAGSARLPADRAREADALGGARVRPVEPDARGDAPI